MQELIEFTPQPPDKLTGLSFYQQMKLKLQSVLTNRSGNAKPSDIVDGEMWCKQIPDGSHEFYVWHTADGAGDGTLLQDYFKVDKISEDEESAFGHKFPTDKAVAKFFGELKKSFHFYRSGDFLVSFNSSIDGFLLCDGSAVSRETYADLFAVIGTTFGDGDGSTTFNLPDFRGRFIQGANGDLGKYKKAGLPNITGGGLQFGSVRNNHSMYGALFNNSLNNVRGRGVDDACGVDFNASRSNPIYGRSSTVQPPAVALNVFIKY